MSTKILKIIIMDLGAALPKKPRFFLVINKVVAKLLDQSSGFHEKSAKSPHPTHIIENSTF